MKISKVLLIAAVLFSAQLQAVDLIIFSKDRPAQLELLLRSLDTFITGLTSVHVIYHAKNDGFEKAYQQVGKLYPKTVLLTQSRMKPQGDFKDLTVQAIAGGSSDHLFMAVDDMVVVDDIDLDMCCQKMEDTQAYCCILRLGHNIMYSYTYRRNITPPAQTSVGDGMYTWSMLQGDSYWKRHHTTDMAVYRKSDIVPILKGLHYKNPNQLDGWLEMTRPRSRKGLCFEHSKVVNIPLNLVQTEWRQNRHMADYPVEKLLDKWTDGLMIDLDDICSIDVRACHTEHVPQFVNRPS